MSASPLTRQRKRRRGDELAGPLRRPLVLRAEGRPDAPSRGAPRARGHPGLRRQLRAQRRRRAAGCRTAERPVRAVVRARRAVLPRAAARAARAGGWAGPPLRRRGAAALTARFDEPASLVGRRARLALPGPDPADARRRLRRRFLAARRDRSERRSRRRDAAARVPARHLPWPRVRTAAARGPHGPGARVGGAFGAGAGGAPDHVRAEHVLEHAQPRRRRLRRRGVPALRG